MDVIVNRGVNLATFASVCTSVSVSVSVSGSGSIFAFAFAFAFACKPADKWEQVTSCRSWVSLDVFESIEIYIPNCIPICISIGA